MQRLSFTLRNNLIDLLCGLAFALYASLIFAQPAWAYVDPSVMTYTIQALAGVAVALSAVAGVLFRRSRRFLMKFFNIDENANKNVEPVVHRLDPATKQPIPNNCDQYEAQRIERAKIHAAKVKRGMPWPVRFGLAFLVTFFLMFTLFMVAPYEMVAAGSKDLMFHLDQVWLPMAMFTVVLSLAIALAMSALRKKAFDVAYGLVTALGVCCWAQAMFMNKRLPIADGSFMYWPQYYDMFVISGIVWVVIIAVIVGIMLTKRYVGRGACALGCVALIFMQAVGVATLSFAPQDEGPHELWQGNFTTQEGIYDLSPKSNVVVFVLDMFDQKDFDEIRRNSPAALNEMTGFTAFTNASGSFVPTRYALPFLLTAQYPHEGEPLKNYVENRYERSTFIKDIYDQGYSVGLYTTNIENGTNAVAPYAMNVHPLSKEDNPDAKAKHMDPLGTIQALGKCALYRDLPWALKKPFWFYTDEINEGMSIKVKPGRENKDYSTIPYRLNDVEYYQNLKADRLELNDQGGNGAFRLIHLGGAHWPYIMDQNGNRANTDIEAQSRGSLHIVTEYLMQMKQLGVYDNSTIIVTADHGCWEWQNNNASMADKGTISVATNPFLMVKPAGAPNQPVAFSDAQTGQMDFAATVMDAVGGNSGKYGMTVFEAPQTGRERLFYLTEFDGHEDDGIRQFVIDGCATDVNCWKPTNEYWDAEGSIYGHYPERK